MGWSAFSHHYSSVKTRKKFFDLFEEFFSQVSQRDSLDATVLLCGEVIKRSRERVRYAHFRLWERMPL